VYVLSIKLIYFSLKDGPTSQHDTIELRGFEDTPTDKTKKKKGKLGKWFIICKL